MRNPRAVVTFSDSGAHVSQIVDSSLQTHLLSHWVRDKRRFTLEQAVRMLTLVPATLWGLRRSRRWCARASRPTWSSSDPDTVAPEMPEVARPAGRRPPTRAARPRHRRHRGQHGEVLLRDGKRTGPCPASSCAARARGGRAGRAAVRLAGKVALSSAAVRRGMGAAESSPVHAREGRPRRHRRRPRRRRPGGRSRGHNQGRQCAFVHLDVTREDSVAASRGGDHPALRQAPTCWSTTPASAGPGGWKTPRSSVGPGDGGQRRGRASSAPAVAIPAMRAAGGGSIINSLAARPGRHGQQQPEYQSSKARCALLTQADTALQYAEGPHPRQLGAPGPILTPMTEKRRADPANYKLMVSRIPLGRYRQSPDDSSPTACSHLASDESSYVTGSELVIDGGWTAQ